MTVAVVEVAIVGIEGNAALPGADDLRAGLDRYAAGGGDQEYFGPGEDCAVANRDAWRRPPELHHQCFIADNGIVDMTADDGSRGADRVDVGRAQRHAGEARGRCAVDDLDGAACFEGRVADL